VKRHVLYKNKNLLILKISQRNQTVSDKILHELMFLWIFLVVVFSWILVDSWGRVYNNYCFETLKLNEKSLSDSFLVAATLTLILFIMIIYLKSLGYDYEIAIGGDQFNDCYDDDHSHSNSGTPIDPIQTMTFFGIL
jgi:hypothetical protein